MKKIAADRNYRMFKRAKKKYSIDDFHVDENYSVSGKSWKTNSAIVTVAQNPGMLDENNEKFYYKQPLSEAQKELYERLGQTAPEHKMRIRGDASFVTQDGKRIKGWRAKLSRDEKAALVFWGVQE